MWRERDLFFERPFQESFSSRLFELPFSDDDLLLQSMYFTAFFTVTCRRLKEKRPKRRKGLSFSLVIPVEQQESFLVLLSHSLDPKCKWSREIIVWEKTTRKDEEEQVKRNNISSNHWCLLTLPRRVKQSESTVSLAWVRLILTWKRSKTWINLFVLK